MPAPSFPQNTEPTVDRATESPLHPNAHGRARRSDGDARSACPAETEKIAEIFHQDISRDRGQGWSQSPVETKGQRIGFLWLVLTDGTGDGGGLWAARNNRPRWRARRFRPTPNTPHSARARRRGGGGAGGVRGGAAGRGGGAGGRGTVRPCGWPGVWVGAGSRRGRFGRTARWRPGPRL